MRDSVQGRIFLVKRRRQTADRVKVRDVYIKTLSDPDVLEEAKKGRMDVDPATGEEPETLVKEIFDSPPEVVERVKKFSLAERDRELVRV
jgi:hypothetical protein